MKIGMISLGCAKNLVNSEQMAYRLKQSGHEVVDAYGGIRHELLIVNTCAFIESAQQEAIDTILMLAAVFENERIIVTGCLSEFFREQVLDEFPEVCAIVGVGAFSEICDVVEKVAVRGREAFFGDIDAPTDESERLLSTGPGWAYIKIAEGCDNRCAYCVIPEIRGRFRSRPMEKVVAEAERLADLGVRELIVVAQDITRYGIDLYGEYRLPELIRRFCEIEGLQWVRLHYLYPDEISDELIEVVASEPKVLKYLDIPIQHINDGILASMNRRGTGGDIRRLITKLRERIPGLVLRTSVIVGLPGEGDAEFDELCEFLLEYRIERAGVFPYSAQPGTPAEMMPNRPDAETVDRRVILLTELQARICDEFGESRVGRMLEVIVEVVEPYAVKDVRQIRGRSYAESPDVDGYIRLDDFAEGDTANIGDIIEVLITDMQDGELIGRVAGDGK